MSNWKKIQKKGQKGWKSTKQFFKFLFNKTVEESKVVSIRASEAGKLTALNTQRYHIQRAINDHFNELGRRIYELSKNKGLSLTDEPSIKVEISALKNCDLQLKDIDQQIGELRKSTEVTVKKIHETQQKRVAARKH